MHQNSIFVGRGSAPDPAGGPYKAPPDPLAGEGDTPFPYPSPSRSRRLGCQAYRLVARNLCWRPMCLTGLGLNILVLFPSLVNRLTAYGIMLNRGATYVTVCLLCQCCIFTIPPRKYKICYLCNERLSASGGLCPSAESALPLGPGPQTLSPPNVCYSPKHIECLDKSLQFRQLVADQ